MRMVGEPNDRPSALLEEMLRQEPGAIRRADGNGLETAQKQVMPIHFVHSAEQPL